MEDLRPLGLFVVGNPLEQWKVLPASEERRFIWIAIVEDAKLGIIDQYKKQHIYIFEKGAKIIQRFKQNKGMEMTMSGFKKIEYNTEELK